MSERETGVAQSSGDASGSVGGGRGRAAGANANGGGGGGASNARVGERGEAAAPGGEACGAVGDHWVGETSGGAASSIFLAKLTGIRSGAASALTAVCAASFSFDRKKPKKCGRDLLGAGAADGVEHDERLGRRAAAAG